MTITCFKSLIVYLLLASFLIVQADLPLSQASVERAAPTGGKCVSDECCCSLKARQKGNCCCASKPVPGTGFALRAASCADDQPQGDAPIVAKFQVVLPRFAALVTRDADFPTLAIPEKLPVLRAMEPPDPPPRVLVAA